MEINIRNEQEKDYQKVEEVTREGFWNHFQPGAVEHFLLHNLRKSPDYISELDFVIEAAFNSRKIAGIPITPPAPCMSDIWI